MIAFLGMYDHPALQAANDRFWSAIRAGLPAGPAALTRDGEPLDHWTSPDLLLAQTCGFPYRARLHGHVSLVGTPDYGLPGCPAGYYRSVLITHIDNTARSPADLAHGTFAYNDALSQSGWAAPMTHLADQARFETLLQTGGHAASAQAVADGRADLAAIDALTWAILCAHEDVARSLRVIDQTSPTPGLPYITAKDRDADAIATAIRAAIDALVPDDRALLHLNGLVSIPAETYLSVPTPPPPIP